MSLPQSIPTDVLQCLSAEQAWHFRVLPYRRDEHGLHLFCADEADTGELQDRLEILVGSGVRLVPATAATILQGLSQHYRRNEVARPEKSAELSENKNFLTNLFLEALRNHSSDIHLEAYESSARIRFRIDGVLIERYKVAPDEYLSLVNRIKVMANLDIAEKRLPQDGRIFFEISRDKKLDVRVSILPTIYGEKIVLRLLRKDATDLTLDTLGMRPQALEDYLEGIRRPNGIVLISGPTGSGKTTTLYATLRVLNNVQRNIVTIEDPIEYTLPGINQVQLKESIGLDFPSALRTFLRQDPDIIMVGEIRDKDTAVMAMRASLTGHLVLSTIHTNSAWGIIARLIDMGIPGYMLADTLNTAVAQRLVRLLCPHCRRREPFSPAVLPRNYRPGVAPAFYYQPVGCADCYFTGYKGRRAIYEVIRIDGRLGARIKDEQRTPGDLLAERRIALLHESAFELFAEGLTSLDEIYPLLMLAEE
jgi:type IV pilus assembly protein PilB